jgi:serine/threonine protein kinase
MADLTGKDVGRYHVVERLGHGGMAEVYKAFDTRLQREVALKVIRKDAIAANLHDSMMKRFEREALALARLSHPNIVQVYDFGSHKGEPYLVMEYLTGGTLSLKSTGKPIPWQEAARLLAPVARALECAHEENILHRDVKPANILLTRQGMPKLSDFGIARILDIEGSTQLTGTNMGIGTPEYMAPEQWGGKPVPQTDVYALGVVFYELLTGMRPYTADTPLAVMQKQMTDPLPRPRTYNPALPEAVEQVLFKALAKNVADRYASMADFAVVLERLMLGQVEAIPTQLIIPAAAAQIQVAVDQEKNVEPLPPPALEVNSTQPVRDQAEDTSVATGKKVPAVILTRQSPLPVAVASESVTTTLVEEEARLERVIPTYQQEIRGERKWNPLPEEQRQVNEPEKMANNIPRRLIGGIGSIAAFFMLVVGALLIWQNLANPAVQARGTATAQAIAFEQTATQDVAIASLSTEAPNITPSPQFTPIGDTRVSEKDGMEMIWVPPGEFSMGSNKLR